MEQETEGLFGRIDHYWKMIPTHHTPSYSVDKVTSDYKRVQVLTLSKSHQNWKLILECPHLEELNLDQPSLDQIQAIVQLNELKRLRIKNLRVKDVEFVCSLMGLEELSLEYVSGFSDLSPLQNLPKLKALHFENLKKVSSFDGLRGIKSLKYLHISGALDWKQPIEGFTFLEQLPELEILSLVSYVLKAPFPAFKSIVKLQKLLEIRIPRGTLDTAEYAFLEVAKPELIKGFENETSWPLYVSTDQEYINLLGKGEGKFKLTHPDAKKKLEAYRKKYEEHKENAREIIQYQ